MLTLATRDVTAHTLKPQSCVAVVPSQTSPTSRQGNLVAYMSTPAHVKPCMSSTEQIAPDAPHLAAPP